MKIVAKERGMGKTEYLIQKSLETGYPIVCMSLSTKELIRKRNRNIKVYTIYEYKDSRYRGTILVDDFNFILTHLLGNQVAEVTFTGDISIDTIKNVPVVVSQEIKMNR